MNIKKSNILLEEILKRPQKPRTFLCVRGMVCVQGESRRRIRDCSMATVSALANDIEDELRAKNLSHFVLRKESKIEEIIVEVYENQSWHPVLQSWGSVVGVHLNAVLDRSPYTDESGTRVLK